MVRHAECYGNIQNRLSGITDFDLTPNGINQAKELSQRIKKEKIDVIYSSPLIRAQKTAKEIANATNVTNICIKENLREINYGKCDGMKWENINIKYPNVEKMWKKVNNYPVEMPEQEEYIQVQKRMVDVINEICMQNKDKIICVVSHGIAIQAFLCFYYKKEIFEANQIPQLKNADYLEVYIENQ